MKSTVARIATTREVAKRRLVAVSTRKRAEDESDDGSLMHEHDFICTLLP
jgi:hypothetical protein